MTPKEMAFTIGNGLLSFRVAGLDLSRVARLDFVGRIFILFTSPIRNAYSIQGIADVRYHYRQR
jgi:hypothetical protein